MRRFAALALSLTALVAGCVNLAPDEPARPAATSAGPPARAPAVFGVPDNAPVTPIGVALALDESWLKPLDVVSAHATAPAASYAWYAGIVGARTRVVYVNEIPYLTDADAPRGHDSGGRGAREGPVAPAARLDSGEVEPGSPARPLRFAGEGRFAFVSRDGADATFNVTVTRDAAATEAFVTARNGRFFPEEVEVAPGGVVSLFNAGARAEGARLSQVLLPLEATGADATIGAVDEGIYEVVVLAREGLDGRGVASARLVADFERPATRASFGPFGAETSCLAPPACDDGARYAFELTMDARLLFANASVGSLVPGAAVVLAIERGNERLAQTRIDDEGGLILRDLPAGEYALVVRPESGAFVAYQAWGDAHYRLPSPPQLSRS